MPKATIIATLQSNPLGLTAKELSRLLDWKNTKASQLMGRMFFAGVLNRCAGVGPDRRNNEYTYTIKLKPRPIEAPLSFPVRIAERASIAAPSIVSDPLDALMFIKRKTGARYG